ncbi:TIGR04086 family membrane protein [Anaerotignum sp. MB30-C6]|uniref:TIGR04086 family membrane protein n=1 Tax=Anaerotignum sp. MB30-C6 TaxID=3070814 RepID=UPI0027DE0D1D|nr:TIGR04086 family membrane protein [Anaerotignum sp. MB30-C6]WMI80715.1 TIGR04086 family membrane protein [Anaerotignum sp. MB30-C6]
MEKKKKESKKKIQKKRESMEKQSGQSWICMVKGMAIAYAITCIFFIAYGLVLTYTNISEQSLPMVALVCTALSSAVAGYDWAKCRKKKGMLMGLAAGLLYTLILFVVTGLASDTFTLGMSKIMTLIVSLAGGGIGGILGVNGKK